MLEQVKRFTAFIRFEFAFQRYERSQQKAHLTEAELQYSTVTLEDKVSQISAQIAQEIHVQFAVRRDQFANDILLVENEISEITANLSIFQRNYKSELQPIYDELEVIKASLQRLYAAKDDAYDDLNSAKASINSWYGKSDRYIFGNKDRKLPQHSFFRQSHGDLAEYKSDREEAHYEIVEISKKIERLKSQKDRLKSSLGEIKQDRDKWHALRNQGINSKMLSIELGLKKSELAAVRNALTAVENEVLVVTVAKQRQYGLFERETQIESLKKQKSDFIASFFTDRAKLKRRALLKKER